MIGVVNVANLVSVRATSRVRELATRRAWCQPAALVPSSAYRNRVARAGWRWFGCHPGMVQALNAGPALGLDRLPRGSEIGLDLVSLSFILGLVVFVGLAVGLFPVIALRRADLGQVAREEGRTGTASRRARSYAGRW